MVGKWNNKKEETESGARLVLTEICIFDRGAILLYWCWIAEWVALSVRVPKGSGSIPGGTKVLRTEGICKYLPVSVSSYVEVCLCLLCSVCIT